jgi:S-DNA-T family DNA segregation ATPase FtsK/SpoIIIE
MAAPKKSKKNAAITADAEVVPGGRARKVRLTFGILVLLAGIFICFSIVSYCFTWQADQDKLLSHMRARDFLLFDDAPVANWGGRMGALLSHTLVYRGAGIASLALGLWITAAGLNLVYGKRVVPLLRYLRWLSLVLLVVAPILTYAMPEAAFSFGGVWGVEAISYLEGMIGRGGTGLLLAAVASFFTFVIFALDISPLIKRARTAARRMKEAMMPAPAPATPVAAAAGIASEEPAPWEPQEPQALAEMAAGAGNRLNGDAGTMVIDEEEPEDESLAFTLNERQPEAVMEEEEIQEEEAPEEEEITEEEVPEPLQQARPAPAADLSGLSFEVIAQPDEAEAPSVRHGAHISIEDNEPYAPELDLPDYKFPTLDLLEDRAQETVALDKEELEKNKNQIIQTLRSFGIEIQRISATIGPTVTLYEIVPSEGVRISKIRNLEDDIALSLAALGIRIIAPIPGKGTIGIEVPNAHKQIVSMRALLSSEKFVNSKMSLPIALGKKIDNENYIVDLATMPHLLMAGATGQGKSVGINAILVSLLYKKHPAQLKFVLVDPKKVELSIYRTIEKHFLAKLPNEEEAIITDTKKVIYTLNALCIEMDNRYELLKDAGARNIKEYNEKFISRRLNPLHGHKYLPFIVLVVDEFADLIMTAGKEIEVPIARLAQLARAVGIHLIIATQRPSVNVITGTIKANFPGRIAFKVSAKVDSRTILDTGGAEQLIGRGDMLVSHGSELLRLQCAFVDTPEVEKVVDFIGNQRGYPDAYELPEYEGEEEGNGKSFDLAQRDKLFEECARVVVQTQNGSTSNLQRRFNLGYNRAGRIMDQLEAANIVGPAMGSKPREVLFRTEVELEQFLSTLI